MPNMHRQYREIALQSIISQWWFIIKVYWFREEMIICASSRVEIIGIQTYSSATHIASTFMKSYHCQARDRAYGDGHEISWNKYARMLLRTELWSISGPCITRRRQDRYHTKEKRHVSVGISRYNSFQIWQKNRMTNYPVKLSFMKKMTLIGPEDDGDGFCDSNEAETVVGVISNIIALGFTLKSAILATSEYIAFHYSGSSGSPFSRKTG